MSSRTENHVVCSTSSRHFRDLLQNLYEACGRGCLSVQVVPHELTGRDRIMDIVV